MCFRRSESPRRRPIPVRWKSTKRRGFAQNCAVVQPKAMQPPGRRVRAAQQPTRLRPKLTFHISLGPVMFFPPSASSTCQPLHPPGLRSHRLRLKQNRLPQRPQLLNLRRPRHLQKLLRQLLHSVRHTLYRLRQPLPVHSLLQRRPPLRHRQLGCLTQQLRRQPPHRLRQFSRQRHLRRNLRHQRLRRVRPPRRRA